MAATPLPLLADLDDHGRLESLTGHFARTNPQVKMLDENGGTALILFMGPQGNISPSWMVDRTQAPTWNYAVAQFHVEISFHESVRDNQLTLTRLVEKAEKNNENPWSETELGDRYDRLFRGIVGFQAKVVEPRIKFKLGQNEREDVFADIIAALEKSGQSDLREWMLRFKEQ